MKSDSIAAQEELIELAVDFYVGVPIDLAESIARARVQIAIAETSQDGEAQNKRAELALLKIQAAYRLLVKTKPDDLEQAVRRLGVR